MSDQPMSLLWYTDRSRIETGLDHCLRDRLLTYHFGPSGYGIRLKAEAIPLATGSYVHLATEAQDAWLKQHDTLPDDDVVREGVHKAVTEYDRVITLRGLRGLDQGERLEEVIQEQKALIEGLTWAYRLHFLPWFHEQCRVVEAETEELLILDCTCGLGDRIGTEAEHVARGCQGIAYQSRPDLIADYRSRPGVYSYWEKKTTGQTGELFETRWETATQFVSGAKAAEARLEIPISEAFVIALIKGRRESSYNFDTRQKDGPKTQQSPLCYGWRRPGQPPFEQTDWAATYDYQDSEGKNRRLGKQYQRTGIWHLTEDMPEVAASGISLPEFWAKWIPPETLAKQLTLIGPLPINQVLVDEYFEETISHERGWQETVWQLHDVLHGEAGGDWTHPAYQAVLRARVPRSWACRRFGKSHQCQHVRVCFQHEGWQEPMSQGYVPRRPHHEPELRQVEARGLAPEGGWVDEEED